MWDECIEVPHATKSVWDESHTSHTVPAPMSVMGLPIGRKSFEIGLAIQTQNRHVTDTIHVAMAKTALARCVARVKKIKVVDLYSAYTRSVSKALRYSPHSRGISQFYLHTLGFIRK